MGNIEPLLRITKPAEGLNKLCQGNVNGRNSLSPLKDLMSKCLSLAKHIRKLWRFPSDKVILELVILLNITQGPFLLNLSMLTPMRRCARRLWENLIDIAKYRQNVTETESRHINIYMLRLQLRVMSRIERSYENCEIYDNSQDHWQSQRNLFI